MTLSTDCFDAVVVGAGVAGGCIAALLADRGWKVLLVEKSAWPRQTVCGGCLSTSALNTFEQLGMSSVVHGATVTDRVTWHSGSRTFEHAIPPGAAILRVDLDAAIVVNAVRRGVEFLPGCTAALLPASLGDSFRSLRLNTQNRTIDIRAGVVISCDGIAGTFLKHEPWAGWSIARNARIGVAATYPREASATNPGAIRMHMSKQGYLGMIQVNESTEHLAAALNPAAIRAAGGPVQLISQILQSTGQPVPIGLMTARLHGTGKLTRYRKQLGGHRVLTVGDACGYVEPVTGEGMAWAALGALELGRLLPAHSRDWHADMPDRWLEKYMHFIGHQQRWCRAMRTTVHHPSIAATGIFLGNIFPGIAHKIAQLICRPEKKAVRYDSTSHFSPTKEPNQIATANPGDWHRQPAGGAAAIVAGSRAGTGLL